MFGKSFSPDKVIRLFQQLSESMTKLCRISVNLLTQCIDPTNDRYHLSVLGGGIAKTAAVLFSSCQLRFL